MCWLQVMFVKVKHGPTMLAGSAAHQAVKYTQWQSEDKATGVKDITTNDWKTHAYKQMRNNPKLKDFQCFDADYYINSAPWEFEGMSAQTAFQHFLEFGFQEGRAYHFTCWHPAKTYAALHIQCCFAFMPFVGRGFQLGL